MSIKKIIAGSLLALSFVPSVGAMESYDDNAGIKKLWKSTVFHSVKNREIPVSVNIENVVCRNNMISHSQLAAIHKLVVEEVVNKVHDIKYDYEAIAIELLNDFDHKTCNGKLDSFYELYLHAAEVLHFLSEKYSARTDFKAVISSQLIGTLNKKDKISFDELRDALIKTLKEQIIKCL